MSVAKVFVTGSRIVETNVEEPLACLRRIERIDTTETITGRVAETVLVTLLTPESVATLIVVHTPEAQIPLGLMFESQLFAAFLADDVAAVDCTSQ